MTVPISLPSLLLFLTFLHVTCCASKAVSFDLRGSHSGRTTLRKRQSDSAPSVDLDNGLYDYSYLLTIGVGSPTAQQIELELSTGSSNTWMFGADSCNVNSTCYGGICECPELCAFSHFCWISLLSQLIAHSRPRTRTLRTTGTLAYPTRIT